MHFLRSGVAGSPSRVVGTSLLICDCNSEKPKDIKKTSSPKQTFSMKLLPKHDAASDLAPLVLLHFSHLSNMDICSQCGKYAESCVVPMEPPGIYYNERRFSMCTKLTLSWHASRQHTGNNPQRLLAFSRKLGYTICR